MNSKTRYNLRVSEDDDDVAYLTLPSHPGMAPGVVKKTVCLRDLLTDYDGADLNFDFDENNTLIGIEILG